MPFWSSRSASPAARAEALFDELESRLALYADPFLASPPDLSALTSPNNTVVRMETTQGSLDIELYDVAGPAGGTNAPITTANFINYIRTGRYDNTFFHRLVSGFVLQGGGFSLKDPLPTGTPKFDAVQTDPAIQNEFDTHRSNVAMTIAMAKLGGNPNSATSQFFFNLADNASNLDNQNGGFTVFGHVIQGWSTVTTIGGFLTRDESTYLGDNTGLFSQVPTSAPNDTSFVTIKDIEIIKAKNQTDFFTYSAYYPEGFRSGRSGDSVDIVNSDPNTGAVYQVIARFENGTRDRLVGQGFLVAGGHITLPVFRGGDPSVNLVRGGVPFGYEVRSTKPVGATLTHTDFGGTGEASFVASNPYSAANLETWDFANGQKGPGLASFLVWMNMSDQPVTIVATFYSGGTPFTTLQVIQPFRRGGFDVNQLPQVTAGLYSVHVTSDQPVAVALSQYRLAPGRADTESGVVAPSTRGFLPGAQIPSAGQSTISAVFSGTGPGTVTIDLDFVLSDGTVLSAPGAITLSSATPRADVDLSTLNGALPHDQFFTIRYHVVSDAVPVGLSYTSITNGDTMTTPFETGATPSVFFGGGFTDPATTGAETISIYNPFTNPGASLTYRVRFHFFSTDQDRVVIIGPDMLAAGHRTDIAVRSLSGVMATIMSGAQFHHYSISIESTATQNSQAIPSAVFAQLTRIDTAGGTVTTGPTLDASTTVTLSNDPRFM